MKVGCNAPIRFWNRRPFAITLLFLGLLNLFGCDVTTTDTVKRLRKNAKNGDEQAQYNLGVCLVNGTLSKP